MHMINVKKFLENVEINEISKGKARKYLKDRKKILSILMPIDSRP